MGYRVLAGIDYPPNKRAEAGDVVDDLAPQSIKWLLKAGIIEDNSKSPKAVQEEPEIVEEPEVTSEPEVVEEPTPEIILEPEIIEEPVVEEPVEPVVEAEGFDPEAKDGDGDGFLQDGTPHQRPVEEE